jgi:hypothetical protein
MTLPTPLERVMKPESSFIEKLQGRPSSKIHAAAVGHLVFFL